MSNVKGDDIDDLFKRAADKYPLRTDSADWNKLAADLDKDRSLIIPPANAEGGDKRRRRRFFWLFLLLPLGGIGYYAWYAAGTKPVIPVTAAPTSGIPADAAATTSGTTANRVAGKTDNQADMSASTDAAPVTSGGPAPSPANVATSSQGLTSTLAPASTPAPASPTAAGRHTDKNNADNYVRTTDRASYSAHKNKSTGSALMKKRKTKGISTGTEDLAGGQPIGEQTGAGTTTGIPGGTTTGIPAGTTTGIPAGTRDLSLSALKAPRAQTTGAINLYVNVNANKSLVSAKDSSGAKNNAKRKDDAKDKKNVKDKKQSFFYAGLIAAPDLSTVKMQTVKGVGTTFGVLLGYQFNKRWAVETGVYLDHKKYYTDGEYFKAKNTNPNYTLLSVDGYCNMWEIPVNLRYNLSSGQHTKWFATAGLSTYLMTRENYVSTVSSYGMISTSPWDIKKPSQYWFSIVNLSIGFDQKLGKIGNLRIEPYVRIPLSGVGTGSLPIMSAGLNIGITRRIW